MSNVDSAFSGETQDLAESFTEETIERRSMFAGSLRDESRSARDTVELRSIIEESVCGSTPASSTKPLISLVRCRLAARANASARGFGRF